MTEQRYQAILAVIRDGRTVTEEASEWRVSRQTMHTLLSRYEAGGLEELGDRSHRPMSCPHQMSGELEAMVLELRRWKPYWPKARGGPCFAGHLSRQTLPPNSEGTKQPPNQ